MTRAPIVLSAIALVVAVMAAVGAAIGAFRGQSAPATGSDEAALSAMIDARIKAAAEGTSAGVDPDVIGPIVRDYMVEHPEILEDVLAALEAKRERDEIAARANALQDNRDSIYRSASSPVAGNPTGDVTLVEFFDYNCGYCKRMLPAMVDLLKTDPNLRVVFKEWPVLTEGSAEAARIALAVQNLAPDRYLDFHTELMSQPGGGDGIGKARALDVAESLGMDKKALQEAAKDPAIDAALDENFKIAEALGLRGTPSYVVGEEVIPGAVNFEALQEKIARTRETGCQIC